MLLPWGVSYGSYDLCELGGLLGKQALFCSCRACAMLSKPGKVAFCIRQMSLLHDGNKYDVKGSSMQGGGNLASGRLPSWHSIACHVPARCLLSQYCVVQTCSLLTCMRALQQMLADASQGPPSCIIEHLFLLSVRMACGAQHSTFMDALPGVMLSCPPLVWQKHECKLFKGRLGHCDGMHSR